MTPKYSVIKVGATRAGKTLSAAADLLASPDEACVILDPHKDSLAREVVTHATGNVLFERLSDLRATLGFDLLTPSLHREKFLARQENERRAEAFVEILLRRRNTDSMAGAPLMEEWVQAAVCLYLFQASPKPLTHLPFAFMPGTREFAALVADCTLPDVRYKFGQLENLSPKALRAEVGSAARLLNGVFRSVAFQVRARGGFDLGGFLQIGGKLVVERGEDIGDDAMRTIMGAIVLLVIEHAKRRPRPYPIIRVYIDEATNARLVGAPEIRALAETAKNGLFFTYLVQNLNFPGGSDEVLQNCLRHEWFGCAHYGLAREAATDIVAGLGPLDDEDTRAKRIARITDEIMNFSPGWRWVRTPRGAWKEYVPLLENPWPDWPGLREAKLKEILQWIYSRPEYRDNAAAPSESSSPADTPPPTRSPDDSSPAKRLKRRGRRPTDSSPRSEGEEGSASQESCS